MLTIKAADEERRLDYATAYGVADIQVQIMRDGDEEIGSVVYTMTPEELHILSFNNTDPTLNDFLLRGILNIGWRRGVMTAICSVDEVAEFLKAEGFEEGEKGLQTEIAAFFAKPCCGCSSDS